ncbi:MAG: hypothetical protein QF464_19635, partial [Myxococcota bacterium]|nr:hypothetical protein [Myxococcota bacterium]
RPLLRSPLVASLLSSCLVACSGATGTGGEDVSPDAGTATSDGAVGDDVSIASDASESDADEACKDDEVCDDGDPT